MATRARVFRGIAGNAERSIGPTSHTRLKAGRDAGRELTGPADVHSVSTLPPPPFQNEADVPALHGWLDAHMALASEVLWLDQHIEAAVAFTDAASDGASEVERGGRPGGDRLAHFETIRGLLAETEAARDALYDLYCDAADVRLAPLLANGAPFEAHVRKSYAWMMRVVALLTATTNGVLLTRGPDWVSARSDFQSVAAFYPRHDDALTTSIHALLQALPLDLTSPVEPLRGLPRDIGQLLAATEELHQALVKRFA